MSVNMEAYKVFYVTAISGSFTAAAKELYLTQPTITHSIRNLEDELQCRLFIRRKKGVQLTPEGRLLLPHAKEACEQLWLAEKEIAERKKFEKGRLYLGANETTLHHFLFPYLKKYKRKYASIHLRIQNGNTPAIIEDIQKDKLDCGVLVWDKSVSVPGLQVLHLQDLQDILIAGKEFRELAEKPVSLASLKDYPFISLSESTLTGTWQKKYFQANHALFQPDVELSTADLIVPSVIHNLGIGLVPAVFTKEALHAGQIFEVQVLEPIPTREICLLYKKEKEQSEAMQDFLSLFHTVCENTGKTCYNTSRKEDTP